MKRSGVAQVVMASALIGLAAALQGCASLCLVHYAQAPKRPTQEQAFNKFFNSTPGARQWVGSVRAAGAWHDTTVTMRGTRMHATLIDAPQPTTRVAVLVHGYHDTNQRMMPLAMVYREQLGYNVVLPDLYAHGLSEGTHVNMGWIDRLDVMQWMAVANEVYRGAESQTQMVVHGLSMGAATVMALSGEPQQPYVKCLVEDCGYTSVWDEYRHVLRQQFHLGPFPVLYDADLITRLRYHWGFRQANMLKQVQKCRLPMLFIHGDSDTFVPTAMVYRLFTAKPGPKEIYVAPGSRHARAFADHPAQYTFALKNFLAKYITP